MVEDQGPTLACTFAALSDPTRRALIAQLYGASGVYREVVPDERLVFTWT